MEESTPKKTI
jgi:hypothetical protein